MEKIRNLSPDLDDQIEPTVSAFQPLLEKNQESITSIPKKTFRFGETERHALDVYYPPEGAVDSKAPVLFFIYGGGFTAGSRNWRPVSDFLYSSVGAFFAHQGFVTIVPDYRLAPEFQYPKAAEDVLGAINWTISHPSDLVFGSSPSPDLDSLFISGHSAGAVHAATLLFHEGLIPADSDLRRRIKGVILLGGVYHFFPGDGQTQYTEPHWGSEANAVENTPVPLLLSWFANHPETKLPKIAIIQAEHEPVWLYNSGIEYRRLLEWHLGEKVVYVEAKSHKHVSFITCLSSGEGEEWGFKASSWIKDVVRVGATNTGINILEDVGETDGRECPKCKNPKARVFEVILRTRAIQSKNFAVCSRCGNKWSW